MVLINGQLMPAATVSLNKTTKLMQQQKNTSGRSALFNSIMDRVKQKTSKNFDLT